MEVAKRRGSMVGAVNDGGEDCCGRCGGGGGAWVGDVAVRKMNNVYIFFIYFLFFSFFLLFF